MHEQIVVALPGVPPQAAYLTTDHPQSSYGLPVVVVGGVAYGTVEVLWVDGSKEARGVAARAGYPVLSHADSRPREVLAMHGVEISTEEGAEP